ncbi:MAG: hypothetical protein E3J83_03280 [Candidatus Atribacteria bacterium]|nr:MAG: hypothetical protein E3J83_03280 [Candidatus Atribacteria bacterium]
MVKKMREFETGATRDIVEGKLDYEGFFSPLVLEEFAKYMEKNRHTALGVRKSDNWQKGIPYETYMKSLFRHFMAVWKEHRGIKTEDGIMKALMGVMFNTMGYAHELLKGSDKNEEKGR